MDVYLVVVHDVELRSREYAVLAKSEDDAKERVTKGEFLTESEPTTLDNVQPTVVMSAEKVTGNES